MRAQSGLLHLVSCISLRVALARLLLFGSTESQDKCSLSAKKRFSHHSASMAENLHNIHSITYNAFAGTNFLKIWDSEKWQRCPLASL